MIGQEKQRKNNLTSAIRHVLRFFYKDRLKKFREDLD